MSRARLVLAGLLAFVVALAAMAVSAVACGGGGGGGKESTTLTTILIGEGKEAGEITVLEGAKVKDKASLSGKNVAKATGKVKYDVYSDKECKDLVTAAGEGTVSGESVTASSEETLEAGKTYYWQATYEGNETNSASTSSCGSEVENVKAKTSLATKLSGEGKEGEELTILEGSKAKDTATLSGTNSSTATGKVVYKVYSDKECKDLVTSAGEVMVSSGSVPASSEEELEGAKTYYWQAHYNGDSLHEESTSSCGSEVLKVKAKTTLSTALSGEGKEGAELTVLEGSKVKDKATVEGTNSSTAEGKVLYKIYSDSKCEHLVAEAGEASVSSGVAGASDEEELEGGKTYYWQATYKGDSLHQESKSACGKEVLTVKAKTSLSTTLSGEGKEGSELTVLEGAKVKDNSTLSGTNSSSAGGKVLYKVYSDSKCEHLVTSAGEVTVSSGSVPASSEEELEGGKTYYWQTHYAGDSLHEESSSECGKEVLKVKAKTTLSTTVSGEGKEGDELTVLEGAKVKDKATVEGTNASTAEGHVVYKVYSDKECKDLVADAGEESVTSGAAAASNEEELEGGKTYYWQAHYGGDSLHQESTSSCGSEVVNVKAKTTLTTTLSGEGKEAAELSIIEGAKAKDTATLEGTNASTATGKVTYKVYSDKECKDLVAEAGEKTVSSGSVPASNEEELEGAKTYYWQASYDGDSLHQASTSECGKETLSVKAKTTLSTTLSGEGKEGAELTVLEGAKIKDDATLGGPHSSSASGKVLYSVYSDSKCEHLVTTAGEATVSSGSVPTASEEELEGGKTYYWQASYNGDTLHQASTSECGKETLTVKAKTTLTTTLAGEGEEGTELTVLESSKAKDTATLSGTNSSTASGKATYKVYSDSKCEHLVAEAGEVTVSSGSVPASSEEELEAGKAYYWQAHYAGDSLHQESSSSCGEILKVKAKTTLSTTLSGEGKEGDELTILEGSKAQDKATLEGANVSTAEGKVAYKIYSDSKCEHPVKEAGEKIVSSGVPAASDEEELGGGRAYYWQAHYTGDPLHQESTSICNETLNIKAKTTLTTTLSGEGKEGAEIEVLEDVGLTDTASLTGTNSSSAGGHVTYKLYSDKECKTLAAEAGEVTVAGGAVPTSSEQELAVGTYYWQATYSGDSLHQGSTSACGSEVSAIRTTTSLSTSLSGEAESGESISVAEGASISDTATLSGPNASMATGTVKYDIYSDPECKELAAEAGEVTVAGAYVSHSSEETLPPGTYYWQAKYSGDAINHSSTSPCDDEIAVVAEPLTTALSSGEQGGEEVDVSESEGTRDTATLHGSSAATATGTVKYKVYSDKECKTLVASAGEVTVTAGSIPESSEETLSPGTYYWQATYSGDAEHLAAMSACGTEIEHVQTGTAVTTSLSGESKSGEEIEVLEGSGVSDTATLSGTHASTASGSVAYDIYSDKECEDFVGAAGDVRVTSGSVPSSSEVTLAAGTYYWQAIYSGDAANHGSSSTCGSEVSIVKAATSTSTSLSGGGDSGGDISVVEGTTVTDHVTLSGTDASNATGTVKYDIYSDKECKTLVAAAGEVTVSGGTVPASSEETLSPGTYYWQATYSGDSDNHGSKSTCGKEISTVRQALVTTSLSGEGRSGTELEILAGSAASDTASLAGTDAFMATGTVKYDVYSDSECKTLVAEAGEVTVSSGLVPSSSTETLAAGTYYWQATYSGDTHNEGSTTRCGEEILTVKTEAAPHVEDIDFTNDIPVVVDDPSGKTLGTTETLEESSGHTNDQWEYSVATGESSKSWPLAFVQDSTPALKARFELPAVTRQTILEKRIEGKPTIIGETTLAGETITFTKEFAHVAELEAQVAEHEGYIEIGGESPVSASKPFPAKTGEEYMTIGWKWTFHEVGASESKTQSLGSSTSDLFLTFETASPHACKTMAEVESAELPEGSRETEPCTPVVSTLLNEGCCGLQPPPANEAQRILRVWGWFNKRGPIRPGGIPVPITFGWTFNIHTGRYESPARPISYYSEIGPGASAWDLRNIDRGERCFDREQMLAEGTGRCGAWADWLVWAISTWGGARVAEIGVVVNSGAGRECGSGEPESCILLVKNWGFRASTPTRNAAFPYWSTAPVDLLGVPGQNIENPPPYFWDHALVRAGEGAAAALFDPSYGNGPFQGANKDEVLQNYQNASIDGYCRPKDLGGKFRAPYECRPSSSGSLLLLGVKGGMEWPGWP